MKITVKEGKAYVSTPYNKDFVAKIALQLKHV